MSNLLARHFDHLGQQVIMSDSYGAYFQYLTSVSRKISSKVIIKTQNMKDTLFKTPKYFYYIDCPTNSFILFCLILLPLALQKG